MIVVFLLTLYAAGGVAVFYLVDREEMKKEVPYGDFPAIASLASLRTTMLAMFMVLGTGVMTVLILELAIELVLRLFKLRLAIFRLNRVLKLIGYKKRVRLAAGRKITLR